MEEKIDGDFRLYLNKKNNKLLLTHLSTNKFIIFDKETMLFSQETLIEENDVFKEIDVSQLCLSL